MPVFKYDGNSPGVLNFNFRRGDHVSIVLPMAALEAGSYTEETVQGVTLYTVVTPFDLTGSEWGSAIGTRGGTPVCEPVVTHNDDGGELTLDIPVAASLATPTGSYSFELAEISEGERQQVLIGTVVVTEGPMEVS